MPNDGKFIRLTRLEPGHEDDDILLNVQSVPFDQAPAYEALSYAWLAHWRLPPVEVWINDVRCGIPSNVVQFLCHRRSTEEPATLWIDALCISQLDEAEKVRQIQLMPTIYGNCSVFTVWLGIESVDIRFAFQKLKAISRAEIEEDDPEIRSLSAGVMHLRRTDGEQLSNFGKIVQIFKRPWWERLWIVQEVAYGNTSPNLKTSRLMCGRETISWTELVAAIKKIVPDPSQGHVDSLEAAREALRLLRGTRRDPNWTIDDDRTLLALYETNIMRKCSDPKDRFVSMLGLAGPTKVLTGITADIRSFSRDEDVYRCILERIELEDRRLEATRIWKANSLEFLREFPTKSTFYSSFWAPDSTPDHPLEPLGDKGPFKGFENGKPRIRFSAGFTSMTVRGLKLRIELTHGQLDATSILRFELENPNDTWESMVLRYKEPTFRHQEPNGHIRIDKTLSKEAFKWAKETLSTCRDHIDPNCERLIAISRYSKYVNSKGEYTLFERRDAFTQIRPGVCSKLERMLKGRSFYMTKRGLIVLGPSCQRPSLYMWPFEKDKDPLMYLALLAGCDVPLLLVASKGKPYRLAIAGEVFIPKHMHGEIFQTSRVPRNEHGEVVLGDITLYARSYVESRMAETAGKKKQQHSFGEW